MRINNYFTPPFFSDNIDTETYCEKLYTKASLLLVEEENELIGFTAFYLNNNIKQLYIPIIGVDNKCRNLGVGSKMIKYLEAYKAEEYRSIGLEVKKSNENAYKFYRKNGFVEAEDRNEKILMIKVL